MSLRKSLILIAFLSYPVVAMARPRIGVGVAPTYTDNGDRAHGFSVNVTSGTAKLVYSGSDADRETMFQNTDATYKVYCGTFSTVSATTGNRWLLRASGDYTTNGTYNVYCVAESGLGSGTIELLGNSEYNYSGN